MKLSGHQANVSQHEHIIVYESVHENRLRNNVNISEGQFGFEKGKSTTGAIFVQRQLQEQYREGQQDLHCIRIDLLKTFDRVPREEPYCACETIVERSSSVVECRTRNRESPGSNPLCYRFEVWAFSFTSRRLSRLSCINEYLAIDSSGNVSDLVLARNCCLARRLPGEAENGVAMNRSVREGKKCKAL